jgi:hypothetical protein
MLARPATIHGEGGGQSEVRGLHCQVPPAHLTFTNMEGFHIMKVIQHKQPSLMHFAAMADKYPRIQPPSSLSAAGQLVWHQTVDALPSSWFATEHIAMLTAYCGHVSRLSQIEAALSKLDPLENLEQFDKLAKLAAGESAKIAMHARSMRLTQQSRLKAETASSRGLGAASAARASRPWEGGDEGLESRYFNDLIAR